MTPSKLALPTDGIPNNGAAGGIPPKTYYYLGEDGTPRGPVDVAFLADELSAGRIRGETQIIPLRSADWRPLSMELGGESAIRKLLIRAQKNMPHGAANPRRRDSLRGAAVATAVLLPPAGIPALVYAARAEQLESKGDFQGAEKARRRSLLFQRLAWVLLAIAGLAFAFWLRSGELAPQ